MDSLIPKKQTVSKTTLDKAGHILSMPKDHSDNELSKLEYLFDEYRKSHLQPLSETTIELQNWLQQQGVNYQIAQRLKRKPQILRKLLRFSVRLTQLQDIGGSRIIVEQNSDVDQVAGYLIDRVSKQQYMSLIRKTDYRPRGRDDSGYRAVHLILKRSGMFLELQIRSRIQHYWAEGIERTSVVYGHHLKELEGDQSVVAYFKALSDLFYAIESGQTITTPEKLHIAELRTSAELVIKNADKRRVYDGYVNEGIVKTLVEKERSLGGPGLNNWLIVFDWNQGAFVSWDVVARDPDSAIQKYVEYEHNFSASNGFEVVLVGSSDVATVRETHSHYFGLANQDKILETLDESIVGFSRQMDIDVGARQILACLHRKRYWGKKTITIDTLKNHYCKTILTFDSSLDTLIQKGLVHSGSGVSGVALSIKRKSEIEKYL